jgi:outer membrane protein assembly factor BamB
MRSITFLSLLLAFSSTAQAGNWPGWRGPNFNGSADETGLASRWSDTENVAWVADLPGPSAATPVVWGDRVFVSSADTANETLRALCFDRKTGKLLWQHEAAKGLRQDSRSTYSSPSPATDGKLVVFFFGNGEMATYDLDGRELWSRNIEKDYGEFAFNWTFATSPLLFDGKLYLQVLQRDVPVNGRGFTDRVNESYLLALAPETGETLWRVPRPSRAVAESREAFTTPTPFEYGGRNELLVVGGDDLTGHDPATGEELWRWGTWNPSRIGHWRLVPSPVASDDVILVCAPKRDPVYAIKAGGNGQLDDEAIAWTSKTTQTERSVSSDVPTPAYYDGDFFVLSDVRSMLSRVDPKTGQPKWTVKTPGPTKYEASPLVADGKVYLINHVAEVAVVNAENGAVISEIEMGGPRDEPVRSSIIAAQGQLFVRTNTKLYCIEQAR